MIRPNQPKKDYQARLTYSGAVPSRSSLDVGEAMSGTCETLWGEAFDAGVTGIRMSAHGEYLSLDAVGSGGLAITTPWGSWSHAFSTFYAGGTLRLELTGVALSVSGTGTDCAYVLTIDSLKAFWEEEPTDPSAPVLDLGAVSLSGAYDGRHNSAASAAATAQLSPEPLPTLPPCLDDPSTQAHAYDAASQALGGYRWRTSASGADPAGPWTVDLTTAFGTTSLPVSGCLCVYGGPSVGWETGHEGTSWRMRATARDSDILAVLDMGEMSCDCPPPSVTVAPGVFRFYRLDRTLDRYGSSVQVVPNDWGVPLTTVSRAAGCGTVVTDDDSTTTTQNPNVCPEQADWLHSVGKRYCGVVVAPQRCGPADGGGG